MSDIVFFKYYSFILFVCWLVGWLVGNGETRKQALVALYVKVQSRVNQILEAK